MYGSPFSADALYGAGSVPSSTGVAAPTQHMGTDEFPNGWRALVDPRNPLVVLGGLLLATVGLAAVAGSVRLGPAKVSASVGKS